MEEEKEKSKLSSFVFKIIVTGVGSALGIAIVAFVAYTVLGVYHLNEKYFEL